jgi:hypothetical protein
MTMYIGANGGMLGGRRSDHPRGRRDQSAGRAAEAEKLVESDNCDIITGIQASNVALACVDYIREQDVLPVQRRGRNRSLVHRHPLPVPLLDRDTADPRDDGRMVLRQRRGNGTSATASRCRQRQ